MNIKKNLKFISHLRKNARLTLTQLSKKTSIPISTLHERLKNNYIIKKHTCLLDFKLLGYTTWATIFIKVASKDRQSLYEMLKKHENVNSSYKIASNYDVMVECIFKDIGCVNEFIESIEKKYEVLSKEVHFIIEDINRENFLTQTELIIS
jgi:DNA-binding Lrp family transcriptional regulator